MSIKMIFIFTFFKKNQKIFKNILAKIGAVFAIFFESDSKNYEFQYLPGSSFFETYF